ncbi:MAG: ABC transporter permease [Actinomycetota bacterium]
MTVHHPSPASDPHRPDRPTISTQLRPPLRVAEREIRFFATTWRASSFTMFVAPALYLVAMGFGLGGLIEAPDSLDGLAYQDFVAPGLMVAAAAQLAAGSGLWPIMAGHRWLGFHRAMVATPISPSSVVSGTLLWITGRSVVQSVVFLVVASALGAVGSWWAFLALVAAGLTSAAFAAPLMAYTASVDSDQAFDPIMRIVVGPLYLFSGAFFPTEALPVGLLWLVRLFPLWHGIELARTATTGQAGDWPWPANLGVVLVWLIGGWYLARRTFTTRLGS